MPTFTVGIGYIFSKFITGMANPGHVPKEAAKVKETTTIGDLMKKIEAGTVSRGQASI